MKKVILLSLILLGCQSIKEDISELQDNVATQQQQISDLQNENVKLINQLNDAINAVVELINQNRDLIAINSSEIILANEAIQDNLELITNNYNTLINDYSNLSSEVDTLISDLGKDIEELQAEVLAELAAQVELLENADSDILAELNQSIEDAVNALGDDLDDTNAAIADITDSIDDLQNQIDCLDYEEADEFILPDYVNHSLRRIREYTDGCDNTGDIIIDSLYTVQFKGGYFRAFQGGEWTGTYGKDENKMNIKGWPDGDKCYEDLGLYTDGDIPGLGAQVQGEGEEADTKFSFDFDASTGDYAGCVDGDATWYVNGVEQSSSEFNVGDLDGIYIITVKVDGNIGQHKVEKNGSSKGKVRGRIKVRRPV